MVFSITGTVCSGIGKGVYYINKYQKKFKQAVGVEIFPGTLNIKVEKKPDLSKFCSININNFTEGGEVFHKVSLIHAVVTAGKKMVKCYIVVPEKSSHNDQIEIISDVNLRETLGISNGDVIEIIVNKKDTSCNWQGGRKQQGTLQGRTCA